MPAKLKGLLLPVDDGTPQGAQEALQHAFGALRDELAADPPSTVVTIHALWRTRGFLVGVNDFYHCDAQDYGCPADAEMARAAVDAAIDFGLEGIAKRCALDDTTAGILRQILPRGRTALVPVGVPMASPPLLQEFGQALQQAGRKLGRDALVVAVGALARRIVALPGPSEPQSMERFGQEVLRLLQGGEGSHLFEIAPMLWLQAQPEADLGHLAVLLGAIGPDLPCEVLATDRGEDHFAAALAFRERPEITLEEPVRRYWRLEPTTSSSRLAQRATAAVEDPQPSRGERQH